MCPNDDRREVDSVERSASCSHFASRLEAFVDGELEASETERWERHLVSCESCRDRLELTRSVKRELGSLPAFDAPEHVLEAVLRAARDETARADAGAATDRASRVGWWAALRPLPVAAAVATLLAAALWLVPRGVEEADPRSAAVSPATEAVVVERAAAEARWALAYVSTVSRRTGERIRDDLIGRRWIGSTARGLRAVSAEETTASEPGQEVNNRHES